MLRRMHHQLEARIFALKTLNPCNSVITLKFISHDFEITKTRRYASLLAAL